MEPLKVLALISILVIDGDTVRIQGPTTYRFVGYNTPEFNSPCKSERVLAATAAVRLQEIAKDGLQIKPVLCDRGRQLDRYGRACAEAYSVDGKPVADILIAEGLAEPYLCGPKGCPRRKNWCQGQP